MEESAENAADRAQSEGAQSEGAQSDWTQQWIEQQRLLLDQVGKTTVGAAGFEQVDAQMNVQVERWVELGKTYLGGLMQLAQSATSANGTEGSAKSPPADEILDAWKAAWSNALSQASAPGGWAELLNRTPPLGLFREQTEAWRAVAAARTDVERLEQELSAVMRRVQADALKLLEERVKSRAGTDQPVQGFRELYNLWVECSEQVFGTVAHSNAFCHLQGELGNASMRLRARLQKVIEQGLKQFDLPTRSEVNSVHQQLRLLKQRLGALEGAAAASKQPARKTAAPKRKTTGKAQATPARKRSR